MTQYHEAIQHGITTLQQQKSTLTCILEAKKTKMTRHMTSRRGGDLQHLKTHENPLLNQQARRMFSPLENLIDKNEGMLLWQL